MKLDEIFRMQHAEMDSCQRVGQYTTLGGFCLILCVSSDSCLQDSGLFCCSEKLIRKHFRSSGKENKIKPLFNYKK